MAKNYKILCTKKLKSKLNCITNTHIIYRVFPEIPEIDFFPKDI